MGHLNMPFLFTNSTASPHIPCAPQGQRSESMLEMARPLFNFMFHPTVTTRGSGWQAASIALAWAALRSKTRCLAPHQHLTIANGHIKFTLSCYGLKKIEMENKFH